MSACNEGSSDNLVMDADEYERFKRDPYAYLGIDEAEVDLDIQVLNNDTDTDSSSLKTPAVEKKPEDLDQTLLGEQPAPPHNGTDSSSIDPTPVVGVASEFSLNRMDTKALAKLPQKQLTSASGTVDNCLDEHDHLDGKKSLSLDSLSEAVNCKTLLVVDFGASSAATQPSTKATSLDNVPPSTLHASTSAAMKAAETAVDTTVSKSPPSGHCSAIATAPTTKTNTSSATALMEYASTKATVPTAQPLPFILHSTRPATEALVFLDDLQRQQKRLIEQRHQPTLHEALVTAARANLWPPASQGYNISAHLAAMNRANTIHPLNVPTAADNPATAAAVAATLQSLPFAAPPACPSRSAARLAPATSAVVATTTTTTTPVVAVSQALAPPFFKQPSNKDVIDLTEDDDEPTTVLAKEPGAVAPQSILHTKTVVERCNMPMPPTNRHQIESSLYKAAIGTSVNNNRNVQLSHPTSGSKGNSTDSRIDAADSKLPNPTPLNAVFPLDANTSSLDTNNVAPTKVSTSTKRMRATSPLVQLEDNDDGTRSKRHKNQNAKRLKSTPSIRKVQPSHNARSKPKQQQPTTPTMNEAIEFLSFKYMVDHEYDEVAFRADFHVRSMIDQVYASWGKSGTVVLRHCPDQEEGSDNKDEYPMEHAYLCICCNYRSLDDSTCELFSFHSAYSIANLADPSKVLCSTCTSSNRRGDDGAAKNESAGTGSMKDNDDSYDAMLSSSTTWFEI